MGGEIDGVTERERERERDKRDNNIGIKRGKQGERGNWGRDRLSNREREKVGERGGERKGGIEGGRERGT
jgi:hypothetical protein